MNNTEQAMNGVATEREPHRSWCSAVIIKSWLMRPEGTLHTNKINRTRYYYLITRIIPTSPTIHLFFSYSLVHIKQAGYEIIIK